MKKFLLILLAGISYGQSHSQTLTTEEDVYSYLKSNIVQIDKIEGIYKYTSYSQKGTSPAVKMPLPPTNVAIVKSNNGFNAYLIVSGSKAVNQKALVQIRKKEYNQTYELTFYDGSS